MSKLKKESKNNQEDLFEKLLAENNIFKEASAIEYFVEKLFKKEEYKLLSLEEFYFELIDINKNINPNFNHSLSSINPKELYSFFDEEKIREVFYSETETSVLFFNKMLNNVKDSEILKESGNELISCINLVLQIQDDDNKKMIDFKAKLYLNILSQLICNKNEGSLLLEKINTNEKEMTKFFCKHLNKEIEFDDLNGHYNTIKSRIYYHYKNLGNKTFNKDGTLSILVPDERAIIIGTNIASKKKFKDFLMKRINELTFIGSTYAYCVSETLSFVDIADLSTLNKLKEVLNEKNAYEVVKDEWFLEKYPEFVELLEKMDMKIIKEEQNYLNSVVKVTPKKKINNRL